MTEAQAVEAIRLLADIANQLKCLVGLGLFIAAMKIASAK